MADPSITLVTLGVALGLFASDPSYDYAHLVDEIAELGATDVLLVVPWYQQDVHATAIAPAPGFSPETETVRRTLRQLHARGLRSALMPIVLLSDTTGNTWRGKIEPKSDDGALAWNEWFSSYADFVGEQADLAQETGATRLCVGSELLTTEGDAGRWGTLLSGVRQRYGGTVFYSANWDHYEAVSFWPLVDEVGVNGYFSLADADERPTTEELARAWKAPHDALAKLGRELGKPLLLSEVGYPAHGRAAKDPWDKYGDKETDEPLQSRLWDAFFIALRDAPAVSGFYIWNWFGPIPAKGTGFELRGRPAAEVVRGHLRALNGRTREASAPPPTGLPAVGTR